MDKELIERLAGEADFQVIDRSDEDQAPGSAVLACVGGTRIDIAEKLQRFAALVAEECLRAVDAEYKAPLQDQHWYGACAAIREGIRAKFKGPT